MNIDILIDEVGTKGFHIVDNFLNNQDFETLRTHCQGLYAQGVFNQAKIGFRAHATKNQRIRSDEIHWLNEYSEIPAIQSYYKQIQKISQRLNQTFFLGLIDFETHFAVYQPGAFYQKHCDQFAATKDRKISCVYYLNQHWKKEDGGELKLYSKNDELIETILPSQNRFVCFDSELPHEVCLTHQPRYSITGWLKSRQISIIN